MDFSFVDAAPSRATTGQPQQPVARPSGPSPALQQQQPLGPATPRPPLQLPTWQEVQAANQPRAAPTILFRPTGLVAAARQQEQQPPGKTQQQHAQQQWGVAGAPTVAPMPHPSGGPAAPGQTGGPGPGAWPGGRQGGPGGVGLGSGGAAAPGGGPVGGGPPPGSHAFGAPRPPGSYQYQAPQPGAAGGTGGAAPAVPVAPPNVVLVNRRQQGNPVLKHIRNVRWQFADIVPDYQLGQGAAALFLSLRYHLLHPEYILHRIREQQRLFRLTVLLVHVDVDDVVKPLGEVTRAAVVGDCTLVCSWSPEECARWLETYKSYESKPASAIQERVDPDYLSRMSAVLAGSVRGINRTDSHTLGTSFGTLATMMKCKDPDAFSACPGIGPTKVRRLMEAFHEPFRKQLRMTGAAAVTAGRAAGATAAGAAAEGLPRTTTGTSGHGATGGNGAEGPGPGVGGPVGGSSGPAELPGRGGVQGSHVPPGVRTTGAQPSGRWGRGQRLGRDQGGGGPDRELGGAAAAPAVQDEEGLGAGDDAHGGEDGDAEEDLGALDDDEVQGSGPGDEGGGAGGEQGDGAARRQQLLELLMSQMPAGDDDVSDVDEEF